MPVSKIQAQSSQGFQIKETCETISREQCLDVGNEPEIISLGFFTLEDVTEDDLDNPIWGTRSMVEQCADLADCLVIHSAKECAEDRQSYYSEDDLEVWCNKVVGYQQRVVGKSLVKDQVSFDSHKSSIAQLDQARQDAVAYLKESGMTKLQNGDPLSSVEAKIMYNISVTDQELGIE